MDNLTVDYTNTHDWNEAEGRCLRCGMTDCGEPCTIDERASRTHAFNRKGLSRSCRICSLGLSADIHRKKGRILPAGNGFANPAPAVDATGRTAAEFLAAAFEFEYCCKCGRDTADHTAVIGPTGGWFAHCDKPEKNQVYECGICDSIHPWDWSGDCREDTNRFAGVDDYCKRKGISETAVEVMSWEDRQAADEK